MSRFTEAVFGEALARDGGIVLGEPDAPRRHSWAEIHAVARCIAGSLAVGVEPGDPVAVLAGEPGDIAPLAQAIWMRGASVTVLHQPTPRADLNAWTQDTLAVLAMIEARVVVIGTPFKAAADVLRQQGFTALIIDDLITGTPCEPLPCGDDDVALLQLSSGSTGMPKAIAITHGNLDCNWAAMTAAQQLDPDTDVMASWLPLFHDLGMVGTLIGPMQCGMDTVLVTPAQFLSAPTLWPELITKYRATVTGGPNFAYALLARSLSQAPDGTYDLSSMRVMMNGAEPIDPATLALLAHEGARFGLAAAAPVAGYGMAEATLAVTCTKIGELIGIDTVDAERLESESHAHEITWDSEQRTHDYVRLGRPVPGMGVRVVDSDGSRLPPRAVGELQLRGGAVTRRFRTIEGWVEACDADGWLPTGDLGYLTDTGEVVICGRAKDTIIVGGRNIFPTDIERAACRVAGVRAGNAAAVRIMAGDAREQFAVVVESRQYADSADVERLQRAVAHSVYEEIGVSPRLVSVTAPGALPKTSSGKLRRSAAAELLRRSGALAEVAP